MQQIEDPYLRELMAHTLVPLYVITTFNFEGIGGEPFESVVYGTTDGLQEWLGWDRIVGQIVGCTDTGAATFLVRLS